MTCPTQDQAITLQGNFLDVEHRHMAIMARLSPRSPAKILSINLRFCLKELRETRRWLRLVSRLKKMNRDPRLVACLAEAEELIRIFVASVRTTERGRNT